MAMNNATNTTTGPQAAAGIDIAKKFLDVELHPLKKRRRFANTPQGHAQLLEFLKIYPLRCIVLESTGGYERLAVIAMVDARFNVHVAHAATIRHFARSEGIRAKTDQIDAALCAQYAYDRAHKLRFLAPIDSTQDTLKALIQRREDLTAACVAEQNRRQQAIDKLVIKAIDRSLRWHEREIKKVEKAFDTIIRSHQTLAARTQAIRQIKGVGPQTARMVIAMLPELGQVDVKRLNSLTGVAPHTQQSGENKGKGMIFGGRKMLRNGLYMACMTAIVSNTVISPFYKRLIKAGKPHKTAMMACIRKMLACMDSKIRQLDMPPSPTGPTTWATLPAGSGGLGAAEAPRKNASKYAPKNALFKQVSA